MSVGPSKITIGNDILVENAKIRFRNFSGKEGRFNKEGVRSFCIFLDSESAVKLASIGWNIRWREPKDPNDEKQAYISVAVNFRNIPPKIILITKKNKTPLSEKDVKILDYAEIENADVIIHPSRWEVNGQRGVKAYLKALYITLVEDEFEAKYRDIPDAETADEDDDRLAE